MDAKFDKNKLISFLSLSFPLLDDFKSKLFLVVFSGLFSSFFIFYFNPFNIRQIEYNSALGHFLSIWSVGILGGIILSFTQFFVRSKLKLSSFNLGQFILWVIFEFTCLCMGVYIFFGEIKEPFVQEFLIVLKYTISLAILPYVLACLLIAVAKLYTRVKQREESPAISSSQHLFTGKNGKVLFAVKPQHILYLKSENNYTSIFYLQNGEVERKLIRTNLKKLENKLENPDLIRIHRSFMVNLQKIETIHRNKGGFQLQLEHLPDSLLNVSESYKNAFEVKMKEN